MYLLVSLLTTLFHSNPVQLMGIVVFLTLIKRHNALNNNNGSLIYAPSCQLLPHCHPPPILIAKSPPTPLCD